MGIIELVLELLALNAKIQRYVAAMVTSNVNKNTAIYSPLIADLFHTNTEW